MNVRKSSLLLATVLGFLGWITVGCSASPAISPNPSRSGLIC